MREIKFRGINNDGNWCFGDLIQSNNEHNVWIHCPKKNHTYKVDPDTVGQFTGELLYEHKIYEGDVLEYHDWNHSETVRGCVRYLKGQYCVIGAEDKYIASLFSLLDEPALTETRLIGNVHDNPELLERRP